MWQLLAAVESVGQSTSRASNTFTLVMPWLLACHASALPDDPQAFGISGRCDFHSLWSTHLALASTVVPFHRLVLSALSEARPQRPPTCAPKLAQAWGTKLLRGQPAERPLYIFPLRDPRHDRLCGRLPFWISRHAG